MNRSSRATLFFVLAASVACGGSKKPVTDPVGADEPIATVGQTDPLASGPADAGTPIIDPETGQPVADPTGELGGDAGMVGEEVTEPPDPPAVMFRITNSGTQDLTFSIDKGWQPIIFGMAGTTPLVLFPRACMSACDAPEEEICPYCPTPDKPKEEAAAEQRIVVAPGETYEKGWDGMALAFEKTQGITEGAPSECLCFAAAEPEPAEYTIKACGFRVTDEPNKPSKLQCVETTLTIPLAEEAMVVDLDFPTPVVKKKRRRRRR